MTFSFQAFQHGLCMSAVSKGSIKSSLTWLDFQKIQDFLYHNGNMHASRSISFFYYMLDGVLIFFRLQFLIFFFKFFRILTFITHTPFVGLLAFYTCALKLLFFFFL